MDLTVEKIENIAVVSFPKVDLDSDVATAFRLQMEKLLDEENRVVIDMSGVQFIDSSGLGAIVACLRKLQSRGGRLKLCCMNETVKDIFHLVRINKVFDILDTRQEAIQHIQD